MLLRLIVVWSFMLLMVSDAAAAYEKLRELSPGTAEIHVRLGLIYFQQGNFTQAVSTLQQAMKLKPALPNIDLLLVMSLNELGRFEEALPGLQKGFRRVTDSSLKRASGLQLYYGHSPQFLYQDYRR
jgi:tetratricopeptide (TPR) repeat protein